MDRLKKYKLKTYAYILTTLIGILWTTYTVIHANILLATLGVLFMLISLDNVFCGAHAKVCGYNVNSHYVIPPFLKNKAPEKHKEE